ncbi:hypothetical protein BDW02DRAFT_571843 [Decorospora gaudefroyi]|uniref:Uncharacterized protein n=1 Tax=Decorospora gaudefroyi TaxID=184978 RepID=A0A6A5KAW0_9PLEO|nr:hypothetical protein BDW02DRAFT_571843 [Decorospora gaudefroyi]
MGRMLLSVECLSFHEMHSRVFYACEFKVVLLVCACPVLLQSALPSQYPVSVFDNLAGLRIGGQNVSLASPIPTNNVPSLQNGSPSGGAQNGAQNGNGLGGLSRLLSPRSIGPNGSGLGLSDFDGAFSRQFPNQQ